MKKIEEFVRLFLSESKYSLKNICRKQNIEVIEMDIETEGLCLTCFNNKFIIINNNLTNLSRDFVIGHQLGHIMLHDNGLIYLKENAFFSNDKLEDEADKFSANMLTILNKEYEIESEMDLEIIKKINKIIYK